MLVAGEGPEDGDLGTWRRSEPPPQRDRTHARGTGQPREGEGLRKYAGGRALGEWEHRGGEGARERTETRGAAKLEEEADRPPARRRVRWVTSQYHRNIFVSRGKT